MPFTPTNLLPVASTNRPPFRNGWAWAADADARRLVVDGRPHAETIVLVDAARVVDLPTRRAAPAGRHARVACGFRQGGVARTVSDGRRTVRLRDRCYQDGYLGTSDPAALCPALRRTLFWDWVPPTSFAHCRIADFFERELVRAGMLERPPDVEA